MGADDKRTTEIQTQTVPEEACSGFCVPFFLSFNRKKARAHFFGHFPKTLPKSTPRAHFLGHSLGASHGTPPGQRCVLLLCRWVDSSRRVAGCQRCCALDVAACITRLSNRTKLGMRKVKARVNYRFVGMEFVHERHDDLFAGAAPLWPARLIFSKRASTRYAIEGGP